MKTLKENERDYFYELILETKGNVNSAAFVSKTSRELIYRKVALYGLKEHLRVTRELNKKNKSIDVQ